MEDRYSLLFNLAGIRYLRAVLGRQPHDEVAPLITDIAAQCEAHDKARSAQETPHEGPVPMSDISVAQPPNGSAEALQ